MLATGLTTAGEGRDMGHVFIVADDHPLFRGALREILASLPEPGTIIEAADFDETARALADNPEADLLLLDLAMPGTSGLSGLALLRAEHPSVPIAIVSGSEDAPIVARALDLGASGFIPKSTGFDEIRRAIQTLLAGDVWLPPDVPLDAERDPEVTQLIQRIRTLTPQQTRVLTMLGRGLLNKQIAYELGISEATIKAHVSAVLLKLGVDSRTQAVIRLSKLGIDLDTGFLA
ncbi:MAG: response regulator transcription factor [Aurantimonas endophytica]|uniref:DNA-binding NarL/FixJ family response regulator n=1 Tax=Aurantimonas endophytica TaxID=1522175 RepID=A0A7W6HFC1_9HYPH|nr:response regulator transcription factor [Aurantimonas endophytica]MBB4003898.1 DNA-binding NarL/FixJ family response regulator [Aurantimonas endophytica]MCO6404749.1 response regulator [Aurantimonas endophytica]